MASHHSVSRVDDKNLLELLQKLEARTTRIESHLGLTTTAASLESPVPEPELSGSSREPDRESGLELNFGEFGLAWFGSIVLLLGIAFLMTYISGLGHRNLAGAFGFVAAGGLYLTGRIWRQTVTYLSDLTINGSLVILYYATLRLHYFSPDPIIADSTLALGALLAAIALQFCLAAARKSQTLAGVAMLLALISGAVSNSPRMGLPLLVVISFVIVVLALRRGWWTLMLLTIPAVYAGHVVWLLNNPAMGNPMQAISAGEYSLVYLVLCGGAFLVPALVTDPDSEPRALFVVVLNCVGLSVVASLAVFALYQKNISPPYMVMAGFLLLCSVALWLKSRQEIEASLYACFGYMALSISIYGQAGIPAVFLWLALQSLLVVSMALWFRSRFLVVVNAIIFLTILLAYVAAFPSSDWVNFSFALVGHASARIMNWQKERLTLRTELLRNFYLGTGFLFVLYALYHALPPASMSRSAGSGPPSFTSS